MRRPVAEVAGSLPSISRSGGGDFGKWTAATEARILQGILVRFEVARAGRFVMGR